MNFFVTYSLVHFSILLILLAMRILLRTYRELKLNCGVKVMLDDEEVRR